MRGVAAFLLLSSITIAGCAGDSIDSCLDRGGCWDYFVKTCRTSKNAQEICDRSNPKRVVPKPTVARTHNFADRQLPKLYLLDDTRGDTVIITANSEKIWEGEVGFEGKSPNIHPVGIPSDCMKTCRITISGGRYKANSSINWSEGTALVVHFTSKDVVLTQKHEPVHFPTPDILDRESIQDEEIRARRAGGLLLASALAHAGLTPCFRRWN